MAEPIAPEQALIHGERRRAAPRHPVLAPTVDGAWAADTQAASPDAEAPPGEPAATAADEVHRSAFPDVEVTAHQAAGPPDVQLRRVPLVAAPPDDSDSRLAPERPETVLALAASRARGVVAVPEAPDRFSDLQPEAGSSAAPPVLLVTEQAGVALSVSVQVSVRQPRRAARAFAPRQGPSAAVARQSRVPPRRAAVPVPAAAQGSPQRLAPPRLAQARVPPLRRVVGAEAQAPLPAPPQTQRSVPQRARRPAVLPT